MEEKPIKFADWELGPSRLFANRWKDTRFRRKSEEFLSNFIGPYGQAIDPSLLCRRGKPLDGRKPSEEEKRALALSLAFALIDRNPRENFLTSRDKIQEIRTTENAELHLWLIEGRNITIDTGYLIPNCIVNASSSPVIRPPLDLHMPIFAPEPDSFLLTGIYETVLCSLRSQDKNSTADRVRVAVEWLAKAWSNSRAVEWPERLVYLKTAFEALTGTSHTRKSAKILREIFESVPHTLESDADILGWPPREKPVQTGTWEKSDQHQPTPISGLEAWFMEFGDVRNTIIHEGKLPSLMYAGPNPAFNGHIVSTAEFLLRGTIKILLATKLGYEDAWRSELGRSNVIWEGEDG